MKLLIAIIIGIILVIGGVFFVQSRREGASFQRDTEQVSEIKPSNTPDNNQSSQTSSGTESIKIIAQNLDTPWAMAFLPDRSMLVTERGGRVRLVDSDGNLQSQLVATIGDVREIGEGGLLGIVVHPQFDSNRFVYLYYTYSGSGNDTLNRVVRMTYNNGRLSEEKIIIDAIPGAANHNGGRIKFGPDNLLYIGTGDAGDPSQSQNRDSLAGKILRVDDQGKLPADNPFKNSVYSLGHRNVQGLTWDNKGQLWATEHGRSGIQSGFDELNFIYKGENYGWPNAEGDEMGDGMMPPRRHSGAANTWAPSGAAFANGAIFFSGLRGQALYKATLSNEQVSDFKELFKGYYGRIREVILGPDNMLYITTSNRDGRGNPASDDDKIIRLDPKAL